MTSSTVRQIADRAIDGARRRHVDPVEWIQLRSAEVALAHHFLTPVDAMLALHGDPRPLAAEVRKAERPRVAAFLYASYDADTLEQADRTVATLLAVWQKGERI